MPPALPTKPSSDGAAALLRVSELSVAYKSCDRWTPALLDVHFDLSAGEVVGVLGESGCGKSTLGLSLLGVLPSSARSEGTIIFHGQNLLRLDQRQLRAIRGAQISVIHQEPGLSLSPVMRVGEQIAEVIRAHFKLGSAARRVTVEQMLAQVQLHETSRIYDAYPHQLSGGELHRVVIAQALACRPDLLIADESLRALDVRTQSEILALLKQINQEFGTAILFITHNPAALPGFAERVLVMYAGRIVEDGCLAQVFQQPLHPYTKGLLQLVPQSLTSVAGSAEKLLPVIPGGPPRMDRLGCGCAFEPRCGLRMPVCESEYPHEWFQNDDHRVNCFVYGP